MDAEVIDSNTHAHPEIRRGGFQKRECKPECATGDNDIGSRPYQASAG